MRINLLSLFSFLAVFGLSTNVFAQNSKGVYIDINGSTSLREKIYPSETQTSLQICGLQKGEEYSIYLSDEGSLTGISSSPNGVYQKTINITAQNECQTFALNTNFIQGVSEYSPVISVVCRTCDVNKSPLAKSASGVMGVPNLNADFLVQDVFIGGDCFDTSGASTTGSALSIGTFSGAIPVFGFDEGIVLSTGFVSSVMGPSDPLNSDSSGGPSGDGDLATISSGNISDVAILEFDFVPTVDQVSFEYVFASEEYCEFAPPLNSSFNDVFGFFLSGPGIAGTINIAEVSSGVPVSINNVNPVTNAGFFIPNGSDCGGGGAGTALFGFDGYTAPFTAVANVIPCETYHIKLAIADAGVDDLFDSAVFLKANSFDAGGAAVGSAIVPITGSNDAYESDICGNASFTFTREGGDLFSPVIVEYMLGGTATNGVDYSGLPPSPIIIPPFFPELTIPITVNQDDIVEGMETITLFLFGACTCETAEVTLNIFDLGEIDVEVPDEELCGGVGIPVTLTANPFDGIEPYFYDWGSGSTPVPILIDTPTESTSYTVTVTDFCGSEGIATGNVDVINLEAVLDGNGSLCGGGSTDLTVNFSGQEGPYEIAYSIDGIPQTSITDITDNPYTLSVNEIGDYTLDFVTTQTCLGLASGTSEVVGSSTNLAAVTADATCTGTSTGSINLTVTNPDGALSYLWSNGSTLEDQASLPAGNYEVTVTAGGCEIIESFTLAENPPISASLVSTQGVDCGNPTDGAIDINSGGGSGTLTYAWNNAATTEDLTGLAAGTYSVTIMDSDNCELVLDNIMVEGSTDVPTAIAVQSGNIDCDNTMVTLSATGSTTGASITYEWIDQDNNIIESGPDADQITVEAAGTYTLTVTNTVGDCFAQAPLTVTVDDQSPIAAAGTLQTIDCINETVQLNGTASANGDNITYAWTGPTGAIITNGTTNSPTVNMTGTYTLTVTNSTNGCSSTSTVEVDEDIVNPMIVLGTTPDLDCSTNDVDLNATGTSTGGFSYQWTTTGTGLILGGTTLTPNVNAIGDYTLVVTNDNTGCTSTETVTVSDVSVLPNISIATPGIITCAMDSVILDASASDSGNGLLFEWITTSGSGALSGSNSLTPTVNGEGTFLLTISNPATGCESQMPITVTENTTPPIAAIDTPGEISCDDTSVTLTTSTSSSGPDISYDWTVISGGGVLTGGTTNAPTVDAPGTYELIVTDSSTGCSAATNVMVMGDPETPIAVVNYDSDITCTNVSANITGAGSSIGGDFEYGWDLDGLLLEGQNSFSLNNLTNPGVYTLTVSNSSNGCESSSFVTIAIDTLMPIAIAASPDILDCIENEIALDGSASSQDMDIIYSWTATDNAAFTTTTDTISPNINAPGTYHLTVTNTTNGCTAMDSVLVLSNEILPDIDIEQPEPIDCIDLTQQITSAVSATGTDITYLWTGTGIIDNADTNAPTVNESGTFTLTATDNENGCFSMETITVDDERELPTADAGQPAVVNCNNETLELNAGASSGIGTLTFEWSATNGGVIDANANMLNPTISAAGTYTVLVTDESNGCEQTAEVIITDDFVTPTAIAGADDQFNCGDESLSLSGLGSSTGDVTYLWTAENGGSVPAGQEGLINPEIMTAGTYNLLVTNNQNGCTETDQVIITEDENAPVLLVNSEGDITCLDDIIGLTATIDNVGTNFDFSWTIVNGIGNFESGENTLTPAVDEPGTYELFVVNNDNNCDALYSITIVEDTAEPTVSLSVSNVIDCNFEEATLNTTGSDNTANFDLAWTNDAGQTIPNGTENPTVTTEGQYTLTITNTLNGCDAMQIVTVTENTEVPTVIALSDDDITCEETNAPLVGTGSSVGSDFSYIWTNVATGEIIGTDLNMTTDEEGDYVLLVTNDTNGCFDSQTTNVGIDADFPEIQIAAAEVLNCITTGTELDGTGSAMGDEISYEWTVISGTGTITGGNTSLNPTIEGPGVYELTVSNAANDCTDTEQVTVTENTEEPIITVDEADVITCIDDEVTLSANSTNGGNFIWTGAAGIQDPESANPTVTNAGTYTVTATHNETGCEGSATVSVQEDLDIPTVGAGTDYIIDCETNSVTLSGTSDANSASFVWTNEAGEEFTGQNVDVSTGGLYTLTVTNLENECSDSDETQVISDQPTALTTDETDADCISGFGSVVFSDVLGGEPGYTFSIDGGESFTQNTAFTQLASGSYNVIVQDLNGCEYEEQFIIGASEELTLTMEDMVTLKLGDSYQFDPQINKNEDILVSILWTPEDSLSCVDCLTPLAMPTESARYSLLLKDSLGCTAEASTLIIVNRQTNIFIPTAFSPNGDGPNDIFYIFADDDNVERIESFQIYSRWGETVHEFFDFPANAPDFGWDGKYRNQPMNPGVFAYVVKVKMADGRTEVLTGDVTLKR